MDNDRKLKLNAARRTRIDRTISRVSEENRAELLVHVEECRNLGHKESSIQSFATAVMKADAIAGKPFRHMNAQDARTVVSAFRTVYSPASLRLRVISFRRHLRWLFQVDRLDELGSSCQDGKAMERVMNVPRAKAKMIGQVLTRQQQDRLVASLKKRNSMSPAFPIEVRDAWVLRGLKASGHRVSEFCSVQLKGVSFETKTVTVQGVPKVVEVAKLSMDPGAPDLKKGEREIYIWEGLDELRAWLTVHPFRDNLDCPLNLAASTGHPVPLSPDGVRKIVANAAEWSGVGKELKDPLTPHDFRHTAATEDARNGDNEFALRGKFGWGDDSKMPSTYVHMNLDDLRDRALAKATKATAMVQAGTASAQDVQAAVNALMSLATSLQGGVKVA